MIELAFEWVLAGLSWLVLCITVGGPIAWAYARRPAGAPVLRLLVAIPVIAGLLWLWITTWRAVGFPGWARWLNALIA